MMNAKESLMNIEKLFRSEGTKAMAKSFGYTGAGVMAIGVGVGLLCGPVTAIVASAVPFAIGMYCMFHGFNGGTTCENAEKRIGRDLSKQHFVGDVAGFFLAIALLPGLINKVQKAVHVSAKQKAAASLVLPAPQNSVKLGWNHLPS